MHNRRDRIPQDREELHSVVRPPLVHIEQTARSELTSHSWFIITMSTGITSILLHQLPYNGLWLRIIADIFFVLNIALFVLFSLISATRYTLYPHMWSLVVRHPHQSLFLATFPVGLGTIINMVVLVCVPAWGQNWALFAWALFAWALWWLDSLMALGTCFHLTYIM